MKIGLELHTDYPQPDFSIRLARSVEEADSSLTDETLARVALRGEP